MRAFLKELPGRAYRSIFRTPPIPGNELEQSQSVAANFFFHIHSAKVHEDSLRFKSTFGLGLLSFFTFLILCVTGVLLMFYYVPTPSEAFERMLDLRGVVFLGTFLRNLHRWSAHAMVVFVGLHLARVFLTGAHKSPREFNWVVGVALLGCTLLLSFTGYLLPWDQLAYWAIMVGTSIASYAPVVGAQARFLLLGGDAVGGEALLRFYVLHVVVLPGATVLLIGLHFWRIRKDGGLARPESQPLVTQAAAADASGPERFPLRPGKTYGLMCVVPRRGPAAESEVERQVPTWPSALVRELLLFVLVLAVLSLIAMCFNAPLEEPANAAHPPNPAKAPWYFLGLQEMVGYSAFWGGIGIPGILALLLLAAPYLESRPGGEGVWFHRERSGANLLFLCLAGTLAVLTLIGSLFRGANWSLVMPW